MALPRRNRADEPGPPKGPTGLPVPKPVDVAIVKIRPDPDADNDDVRLQDTEEEIRGLLDQGYVPSGPLCGVGNCAILLMLKVELPS